MRDEAEIRGHRRTYIGALPGQIIQGLRRAESKNPVFILDEIDKLGSDFRGDPASALLEVLDPEQNNTFRDHYLDVPFDLSEVLFITTANVLDPIPPPLRDRMEVLELAGYTEEEKLQIAREHLVAKQVKNHGLTAEQVRVHAGCAPPGHPRLHARGRRPEPRARDRRALPQGGAAPRRRRRDAGRGHAGRSSSRCSGAPRFLDEEMEERTKDPGVAIGLAWTPVGGEVLFIEASRMAGAGSLTLTGQLGDVMKESARAALSWFRAHAREYGIDPDFFKNAEIHLHVPSGAIPKDGPSAGVTMAAALASELTGRPVRGDIAMTGEITLSGRVLPVGGIKEKVLAARRVGIREVILPRQNEKNVNEDLTPELRKDLTVHLVSTIDEVLALALQPVSTDVRPVSPAGSDKGGGRTRQRDASRRRSDQRRDRKPVFRSTISPRATIARASATVNGLRANVLVLVRPMAGIRGRRRAGRTAGRRSAPRRRSRASERAPEGARPARAPARSPPRTRAPRPPPPSRQVRGCRPAAPTARGRRLADTAARA